LVGIGLKTSRSTIGKSRIVEFSFLEIFWRLEISCHRFYQLSPVKLFSQTKQIFVAFVLHSGGDGRLWSYRAVVSTPSPWCAPRNTRISKHVGIEVDLFFIAHLPELHPKQRAAATRNRSVASD